MARVSATDRAETRLRLLEAAKTEFAERGLAGARFDEISLAAGCAKGTIYNYFANKEVLFFTIVEEWCALISSSFDGEVGCSAADQLLAIARLDTAVARKDPDLARVVVQQMPALVGSHGTAVRQSIAPGIDLLTGIFADGLATGELRSPHPAPALARLFLAALSAFELEALMPDPLIDLDDVVDLVERHFVSGLVAA